MIPGLGRGMNPQKMKRMMKQMGLNIEELSDVEKIVILTSDKKYVFDQDTSVTIMTTQGQKTFQITGTPSIEDRGAGDEDIISSDSDEERGVSIPQADIELVCDQTGASEEEARAALEECNGNPAEAILKLLEK